MILFQILISENANEIYTNDMNPIPYYLEGDEGLWMSLQDAKIMESRFIMLWDYEKENEKLAGDLWLMESELEKKTLKDKIKTYGLIATITIILVESVILSINK